MKLVRILAGAWFGILVMVQPCFAANHYVRAAANGTGTGADWTNACRDFTGSCAVASMVRGDTYYVGTGTYAQRNFNTPTSGTSLITVKGATVADHGAATGWSSAFSVSVADGGSQAVFTWASSDYAIGFDTNYWMFDGVVGVQGKNQAATYGFTVTQASCSVGHHYVQVPVTDGRAISNLTIAHVAVVGCGPGPDRNVQAFQIGGGQNYASSLTYSHNYCDLTQQCFNTTNLSNSIIEYTWSQRAWSSSGNHGETIAANSCRAGDDANCSTTACVSGHCETNNIVRYNYFLDCSGTACVAAIGPGHPASIDAWQIYGNVFSQSDNTAVSSYGLDSGAIGVGNGTIAAGGTNFGVRNTLIYNNTFLASAKFMQCESSAGCSIAGGNVFKNNLIVKGSPDIIDDAADGGQPIDHDYNAFFQASGTPAAEAHRQVSNSDPLVNSAISGSGNYHLVAGTAAGLALPSPYTTDGDGNTRGGDGNWDRGAFEFSGGGTTIPPPPAPLNPRIVP